MKKWGTAVLIALFLELTLFQYSSYMSVFSQPDRNCPVEIYAGGVRNEDGTVTVTGTLELEVTGIDRKVDTLKLSFTRTNAQGVEEEPVTAVSIYALDEANGDYFVLPDRQILNSVSKSQYMKLHLSGKCKGLVIAFAAYPGDRIRLDDLVINPRIPASFSWLRFVLLTLTFWFLLFAAARDKYDTVLWDPDSRVQKRITFFVILLQTALFIWTVFLNPAFREVQWEHHSQYHELAVALSKGQTYLEEMPPAVLQTMENPYDFVMRNKVLEAVGESCKWDTAYYNGKYYVYFGIVPALIFYLPWYLITGTQFPTWLGIFVTGIVFILAVFRLASLLVRKYFPKGVPYPGWLLGILLMINGCGALMIMRRPDFYSLPILMGVTLSVLGIGCWISSVGENEVSPGELVLGCFFMALVAGCRPQLLLGSFLIFPIYWEAVFQKRLLFSRKSKGRTALAFAAYGVVAVFLMYYNFRRFGSPFDFGANYNLTTNDMTRRGVELARLPYAFFTYLFQLPNLSVRFPYLQQVSRWSSYMGKTISEGTFGGFFAVNLMPAAAIWMLWKKNWFPKRSVHALAVLSAALGGLIVCVDAEAAGVLLRYFSDFGWLFYLAALIAWFAAWQYNCGNRDRRLLLGWGQNAAFAVGMAFCLLLIFTDNGDSLAQTAPSVFYSFYYQLAFWL